MWDHLEMQGLTKAAKKQRRAEAMESKRIKDEALAKAKKDKRYEAEQHAMKTQVHRD